MLGSDGSRGFEESSGAGFGCGRSFQTLGVVEDHGIWVCGLQQALRDADIDVMVSHAEAVDELLCGASRPDLVVLDLLLRDASSPADNIAQLRAAGLPVLVITSGERPDLVREAAQAGVLGVVRKSESDKTIVASITAALRGEMVGSVDWAAAVDGDAEFVPHLSPREREVLALWASGETASGVAETLGISVNSVNKHLQRIRDKYEQAGQPARTKSELRDAAQRRGLAPRPWWRPRPR